MLAVIFARIACRSAWEASLQEFEAVRCEHEDAARERRVVLTAEDRARVREFAGFLGLIRPGKGARRLLSHGPRQDAVRLLGWGRNTLTRKIKEHEEC